MSGSIDLFDDISSDESFDDGESSSESLTVDSSDDDSDDEEIQAPVLDPLAPHWSSVLDAVDVPPFCARWDRSTLYRPRQTRRISLSYCSVKAVCIK